MHLSVNRRHMIGLKRSCTEGGGLSRVHQAESHRCLISNDLGSQGPRLHGCVVQSRHSRPSEKHPPAPWGQKQHSFAGSNGSITPNVKSRTKELLCHSISNRDKCLGNRQLVSLQLNQGRFLEKY